MTQMIRFKIVSRRVLSQSFSKSSESKVGEGDAKFKIDWTNKRDRHRHAILSNPVIKPYHSSKKPFVIYEKNSREDREKLKFKFDKRDLRQAAADAAGIPLQDAQTTDILEHEEPETKIQRKIRELEEAEQLKYYSVQDYKVK
jgi:hypothetical protein